MKFFQKPQQQQPQPENDLQKQFEASLKEQQSALKLAAKQADIESQKSKLEMALMGQNAEVAKDTEEPGPLQTKKKDGAKVASQSASGADESSSSDSGE